MASDTDGDDKMEKNEWTFCSLWSTKTEIRCAKLLVNSRLGDDYFFNRATIENCDVPYERVAKVFWEAGMDCHLYFRSRPPRGIRLADIMYVLNATENKAKPVGRAKVTISKPSDIAKWTNIFCASFSVPEWKDEVARIITANAKKLDLLLAYNVDGDSEPAGCAVLFTNSNRIGLYCLGTTPTQRGKGVAKSILNFARAFAEKRGASLFLQTLGSENVLGVYESAGFEIAYTKAICIVPRVT